MPPKKAPVAAKPRKTRAASKPTTDPATKKKATSTPKAPKTPKQLKRRQAPSTSPSLEEVAPWDRNITTQAQREKKRFRLSMATMNDDIDEEYLNNLAKNLIGESRDTWGIPEQQPIKALVGKKQRARRVPNAFQDAEDRWLSMMEEMQSLQPVKKLIRSNSPNRSPILRLALEVREEIYKYLLIYPKPIMVKQDWTAVERNPYVGHNIIFVCKQFAIEASAFVYRNNTFQALLRNLAYQFRLLDAPALLPTIYHSNLRNLVIDCSHDCWNLDWHKKTAKGIAALAKANAVISSLTLVMSPQRIGMSTTALGVERTPITFADFLWYHGPLMTAIRKLAPRVLKIITKKGAIKRFGMEVDMRYLQAGRLEVGPLANRDTIWIRKRRITLVEVQLMSLKDRFEEIFVDDERAVATGRCTLLADDKAVLHQMAALREMISHHHDLAAGEGGEMEEPIEISSRSSSEEPSDSEQ
ncbi:uncharacterized protein PAC_07840 [Phialocephala subalpina]|uniref:Uncharacterized protein n=1 Tax=Phialocephala subalpina TaxID=576137 RepID=A0A1L7WYX5_9HELO|nr:uncharacterized protein PAC_07840 [Phialocephala subalpina]